MEMGGRGGPRPPLLTPHPKDLPTSYPIFSSGASKPRPGGSAFSSGRSGQGLSWPFSCSGEGLEGCFTAADVFN